MNATVAVALTKARGDNTEIGQIITKATITTTLLATAGTAHTMEEEEDTMPEILEAAEEETVVEAEEGMVEGTLEEAEVEETVEVGEAGMVEVAVEEGDATEEKKNVLNIFHSVQFCSFSSCYLRAALEIAVATLIFF